MHLLEPFGLNLWMLTGKHNMSGAMSQHPATDRSAEVSGETDQQVRLVIGKESPGIDGADPGGDHLVRCQSTMVE